MSRASAVRICHRSSARWLLKQTSTLIGAGPAAATPALRTLATVKSRGNCAAKGEEQASYKGSGFGDESPEPGATDDAARRRAELLKRYGDRGASSGPIAVKRDAAAADAQQTAADEADHNEIWGDYVRYMEHQRKKGWKT